LPGAAHANNIFASARFFGGFRQAVNEPEIQKLKVVLDDFQINK
jgi:hypothetical protein